MCWRWWTGVGLLLSCLLWIGCRPSDKILLSDTENPHIDTGVKQVQALAFDRAIQAFEKALEINPRSIRAHYELGVIHERQKQDYVTALYHYNKVLQYKKEGWPVENVQLLIDGCRQELIKAEALAPVAYAMQRELAELRKENKRLQKELDSIKTSLRSQRTSSPPPGITPLPKPKAKPSTPRPKLAASNRHPAYLGSRYRYHIVRSGETLAAISRRYGVSLSAIQSANSQVNPRSMQPGQRIRVPSR